MSDDVLVLLDGSAEAARAIGPAAAIAQYLDTSLITLSFYQGPTPHELTVAVDEQLQGLGHLPLEVAVEPLVGSLRQSLTDQLDRRRPGLICMSTHGRGRSAALVGSVAVEVLDVADMPVLLVGPNYRSSSFRCHGPLVVALNGSDDSRSILSTAQSFSARFDYELEIATVVDPGASAEFEQLQASWGGGDDAVESASVHNAAAAAGRELHAPVSFTVLHGANPARALTDYATRTHATLLAMATTNPTGIDRVVTGSTVSSVARMAPCPILAIRVPGEDRGETATG